MNELGIHESSDQFVIMRSKEWTGTAEQADNSNYVLLMWFALVNFKL